MGIDTATIGVLVVVAALSGSYAKGRLDGASAEDLKHRAALEKQAEEALKTQHAMQEKIDGARIEADGRTKVIGTRLDAALRELRKRPQQRMPAASESACQGGSGAGLSGPDAEFLARESARANELRSKLAEAYRWIDAVTKPQSAP